MMEWKIILLDIQQGGRGIRAAVQVVDSGTWELALKTEIPEYKGSLALPQEEKPKHKDNLHSRISDILFN